MVSGLQYQNVHRLTVCPEKVIEELEKRKAIPALGGLNLQSGIHVDGIESQEVFCMLHHEVRPPCKRLQTQQEGQQTILFVGKQNSSFLRCHRFHKTIRLYYCTFQSKSLVFFVCIVCDYTQVDFLKINSNNH